MAPINSLELIIEATACQQAVVIDRQLLRELRAETNNGGV
jgi:hypothetical protein